MELFDYGQFTFIQKLGSGQYGEAHKATYSNRNQVYAVKVPIGANPQTYDDFKAEQEVFSKAGAHPNIVRMLGYCNEPNLCIVMEFLPGGTLEDYLETLRRKFYSHPAQVNSKELEDFGMQVAEGMRHLESRNIVHRDLAVRNVLMTADKKLKISDFGLSRNAITYNTKTQRPMPWRWMALESCKNSEFTSKSDVWSFGVLLWEIATLGGFPYSGIDDSKLIQHLDKGNRLEKPENVKQDCYNVMLTCWKPNPQDRPSFSGLVTTMGKLWFNSLFMELLTQEFGQKTYKLPPTA